MAESKFETMKNGYNRYQVDAMISQLTEQIDTLEKKLQLYTNRLDEVEEKAKDYKEKYLTLYSELRVKEKAAEDMARIALKEANVIVQTATENADVIIKEALTSAKMILIEVSKLGEETGEIKGRMLKQLDNLDKALNAFEIPPLPDMSLLENDK